MSGIRHWGLGVALFTASIVIVGAPASADANEAAVGRIAAASISAGDLHTCAVLDNGRVQCWGANFNGQLGYGDTDSRGDDPGEMGNALPTVDLGTRRTATAIIAGGQHTCALLDNGRVKCWGEGAFSQLGYGDTDSRGDDPGEMGDNLPTVNLGTGRTATAITAGSLHTCALLDNRAVKCWGQGFLGRLGYGDPFSRGGGPGEMGDNLPTVNLGTGRTAIAITAGQYHTCALLDNRAVKCWGFNRFGQLGYGDRNSRGDDPREMGNALLTVDLGTGRTATVITAGGEHTCALLDNGSLKCWGSGLNGRLGAGGTNDRGWGPGQMGDALPAVELGTRLTIRAIAAGGRHTCAVLNPLPAEPGWEAQDASVTCWGDGGIGQLGYEVSTDLGFLVGEIGAAVDLGAGRAAAAVSAGKNHTCALLDNSTMKCWGGNVFGELGQGIPAFLGNEPGEMGDNLPPIDLARPVRRDVVRPDGLIRPSNQKLRGNDIYNTTGARQTARAATTNKPVRYTWRIQNDGNVAGRFTLRGTRGTQKFVVVYKNGAKDITRAVTKGTYRLPRLGADASANITVTVRPTTRARPTDKITVTLTTRATDPSSTSANPPPALADTVRAVTTRR